MQVVCNIKIGLNDPIDFSTITLLERNIPPELSKDFPGMCSICENKLIIGKYIEYDFSKEPLRFLVCRSMDPSVRYH